MNMNKPRNNNRIESQINNLKTITTPQIRVRSAKADPPAVTNNGRFISRKVVLQLASANKVTIGDISLALKNSALNGPTGDFFIEKMSVWNSIIGGGTPNGCSANINVSNLLTSGRSAGGSDQIYVTDYGTGSRLSGFEVLVPASGSLLQNFDTIATADVINALSAGTSPVVHVTVRQQL